MEIKTNFKGTNIELTEAMKDYAEKKMEKVYKHIENSPDTEVIADIELGKEISDQQTGEIFMAEANLRIAGEFYRAVADKEDLYAAIDEMRDELVMQLNKDKGRKRELRRKGGEKIKDMLHNSQDTEEETTE